MIRRLSGVERFSKAEQSALQSMPATIRTVEAQRDIIHEGDPSTHCCVVLDGWTCCYQLLSKGRRQILSFHVPGDLPDLQGLYLQRPDFGMAAITRAVVAFVPHAPLRELADTSHSVRTALWRETLTNAAIHRAWITSLGRRDARQRLAHLFCELYLRLEAVGFTGDHVMPMPIRQPDLADASGLTVVHLNRTLKVLRTEGLIELHSRKLKIHNWGALVAVAEFSPQYLHLGDA